MRADRGHSAFVKAPKAVERQEIAAVGILVTVLSQVLKHSGREEHAFLTSLAGLIIVLFWIIPYIYELFQTMESLFTL